MGSNAYCTKCHHWFNPTNGCPVCQTKKPNAPEAEASPVKHSKVLSKVLGIFSLGTSSIESRILGVAEALVKEQFTLDTISEMFSSIKESKYPEYIVLTSVKVKTSLGGRYDQDFFCYVTLEKDGTLSGRLADEFGIVK